jgi:D-glycero-D-manno-heptose 1,7-bisphosphate phosphatase
MLPAIFLDRDGVLIENRHDYVREWSDVKVFPDAIRALARSAMKNYKVVIVTNQSAVGRGLISLETANEINGRLVNLIHDNGGQVDAIFMCPHSPDDNCACRKPKPGLLLQAAKELSLNLQRSWIVGDAWSDVQAGQAAGVQRSILLRTGRGNEQLLKPRPVNITNPLIFDNLTQAIEAILAIGYIQNGNIQA